jgi:hypothetical protein
MSKQVPLVGSRRDAGDDLLFGDDDEFGSLAPAHKLRPPVRAEAPAGGQASKGAVATHGHVTTGASDAQTTPRGDETPRLYVCRYVLAVCVVLSLLLPLPLPVASPSASRALLTQLQLHARTAAKWCSRTDIVSHVCALRPEPAAAWEPDAHTRPAATQEVVPAHAPRAAAPQVHLAPADMQLALVPTPGECALLHDIHHRVSRLTDSPRLMGCAHCLQACRTTRR